MHLQDDLRLHFATQYVSHVRLRKSGSTYFFQCHAVLDQQRYPRIQISYVLLQHEILLRLT